jgi:hypothetical protein
MNDVSTRPGPPDELDGLLREFFQSELPCPWPAAPNPPARSLPSRPFRPPALRAAALRRSRLALAASVALLALGALFAAGKVAPNNNPPPLTGGSASSTSGRPWVKTSLSLEQDPAGATSIRVDVVEDGRPPR